MLIKHLPKEIQEVVFQRQKEQGKEANNDVDLGDGFNKGNFRWGNSKEGWGFWDKINSGNYDVFYERYPEKKPVEQIVDINYIPLSDNDLITSKPIKMPTKEYYGGEMTLIDHELSAKCLSDYSQKKMIRYDLNRYDKKEIKGHLCSYVNGKLDRIQFQENTAYHCETEEEANALLAIAHKQGLKWKSGLDYNYHNYYYKNQGLGIFYDLIGGFFFQHTRSELEKYTIIKASEILTLNNKYEDSKTIVQSDNGRVRGSKTREELRRQQSGFTQSYRRQGVRIKEASSKRRR